MSDRAIVAAIVALVICCACGAPSPEERMRELLHQAEAAAEEKDLSGLMGLVSNGYSDDQGRTHESIRGQVAFYFRQSSSLFVLTKIDSLEYVPSGPSRVTVLAAIAQQPVDNPGDLREINADLLRLELSLEEDSHGAFRIVAADVSSATLLDFF